MDRPRLLALAVAVAGLLALAGIASRGRPLAGAPGGGPTAAFFDYVLTSVVIVGALVALVGVWALLSVERRRFRPRHRRGTLLGTLLALAASVALALLLVHSGFLERLRNLQHAQQRGQGLGRVTTPTVPSGRKVRSAHLRWGEIVVVAVLLGGVLLFLYAGSRTTRRPASARRRPRDEVSHALDVSVDDLLADPDLRRAIIAAYARMERALAQAGLPRRPSEAPFEYVGRALVALDASAASARRLTELFEWAKFSRHEPRPETRAEAVSALLAVRDELRAPEGDAVPA